MEKNLFEAIKNRRTVYNIDRNIKVNEKKIENIINEALLYAPTGFNSQSNRIILALGESHEKVWDLITEKVKETTPREDQPTALEKINKLRAGYGTVLFFEDKEVVKKFQNQFKDYASYFQSWSQQASGMVQYLVWLGLSQEGIGASLQHYNVVIAKDIRKLFDLPDTWFLVSQMPFGNPTIIPSGEKQLPKNGNVRIEK